MDKGEVVASSETIKEIDELNDIENLKKVEAALFISARFLSLKELVLLTDINPLMVKEYIGKIIEKYNKEDSAIEIIIKKDMWKMDVRSEYVSMINKLATGSSEFTSAEQETLAVIAYKQPVKQSVVIKIRGNKAYDHVKHFIDIGLVQSKKVGHTKELKLSDDFFEYFHLQKKEVEGKEVVVEESEADVVVGNEIVEGEVIKNTDSLIDDVEDNAEDNANKNDLVVEDGVIDLTEDGKDSNDRDSEYERESEDDKDLEDEKVIDLTRE